MATALRGYWLTVGFVVTLFATPVPGQDPVPPPVTSPTPIPKPVPEVVDPEVIDPARAAAEILRRRLGLKPGPVGEPPPGPVIPPKPSESDPLPTEGKPLEQGALPTQPTQQPGKQQPGTQQQDPKPAPPKPPVVDPTDVAAKALKGLLPRAKPPEVAPMPTGTGAIDPPLPAGSPSLAANAANAANAASATTLPWSGSLSLRYRVRHGAGATDQDLVAGVGLDVGRAADPVSVHVRARGFVNADGRRRDDPFPGLDHSFGDDVNARLYAANVDLRTIRHVDLVRLGRQDLDETPTMLSFDGVRVDSERFLGATSAWLTAYGGVPVHHFEASSRGDSVFGVGGGFKPWRNGRVRLDWMQLRDDFLAIARQDDLLGVRWWQTVGDVQLRGLHTWRDGQERDLQVTGLSTLGSVTDLRVSYRELLSTQRRQVTEIDPYFVIASDYVPYRQIEASLTRDLMSDVTASVGGEVRRLSDRSEERRFNREFEHFYTDLTWSNVAWQGLSMTLVGNLWHSSGESFRALTGELAYRPDKSLRVALGAGYDLFQYDLLQDRDRLHVRSIYLRLDRQFDGGMRVNGGYELQRDDFDEFHVFRLGVTWTF